MHAELNTTSEVIINEVSKAVEARTENVKLVFLTDEILGYVGGGELTNGY